MADHTYEYVECSRCAAEARKVEVCAFGRSVCLSPPGWLYVDDRDNKKLWDLCPECAKAFTSWLVSRATQEQTPLGVALAAERATTDAK